MTHAVEGRPSAPAGREALYQELIMQRARAPLHAGILALADRAADGSNPFCGDQIHLTLELSETGTIENLLHQTRACAICTASADLMAETVVGLDEAAIRPLFGRFDAMLHYGPNNEAQPSLGLLEAFENLHEFRSRIRCATLPWTALLEALSIERIG